MNLYKYYNYLIKRYVSFWCITIALFCGSLKSAFSQSHERPVIIEMIVPAGATFNAHAFAEMKGYGSKGLDIKTWKDHVVVYAQTNDLSGLRKRLQKDYPGYKLRIYENPFYNFNRTYCDARNVAKEWDNIILSTNLVANPKLQKEYLDHHVTQFQKWPEVSKGFCNASFQQLLVFRNGRQLMLVISIPKGASLDKLNPLTTKNNPRVNEWNKLMQKYQEGIAGTKKGEVWVFFKDVESNKY